jgi:hypothetical protein
MDPSPTYPTFAERLHRRKHLWWGRPPSPAVGLHRLWDRYRLRDHRWPLARWRCCDVWQRSLLNKWNAREFATMLGVTVPELYWSGRRIGALPLNELPERFVIRPAWGTRGAGIYVMNGDTDLISARRLSRQLLHEELRAHHGPVARFPLLVEALIPDGEGRAVQGHEYRCYLFGGTIGAIRVTQGGVRAGEVCRYSAYYSAAWQRFDDPFRFGNPLSAPIPRPPALDRLLEAVRRIGTAAGTFLRVDCYLPPSGPVFGEISSTPSGGLGYTPFANALFGRPWQEHLGDAS